MPWILRRSLHGLSLIIGVTFLSFLLMVWFGPDQTYTLIGKNASAEQIEEVRRQLGYDRGFLLRYGEYLRQLVTFDLGHSNSSGESVSQLLARTLPVSLMLMLPGFLLGNLLGIVFGLWTADRAGSLADRWVTAFSVVGMSLSFLVIIIVLQVLLGTPQGIKLFPARGWEVHDLASWFQYAAIPSLAMIVVTLGYNTRFCRAVFVAELNRDHILAARAFGASRRHVLWAHVLPNSLVSLTTRILFSIPLLVISGSVLMETYFGIPGIGKATFDAISNGDQPVLKAVVGLTALAFVLVQIVADMVYPRLDPRIS